MSYLVVDAGGVVAIDLLSALKKSRVAPVGVGLALRPTHIAKHFGYAAQLFGVVVLFLVRSKRVSGSATQVLQMVRVWERPPGPNLSCL